MDADDTLLDFGQDEENAFKKVCDEKNIAFTPLLYSRYSEINLGLWKQFEKGEITKADILRLRFYNTFKEIGIIIDGTEYSNCYGKHLSNGGIPVDGAIEVCQKLKDAGYKLYIITNGIEYIQEGRFKNSNLGEYFEYRFISECMGVQKPKKEYFDKVLDTIGCQDKEKYLIVGDSLSSDILGGINSGIDTCWINRKNIRNDTDIVPDYLVKTLKDILEILL